METVALGAASAGGGIDVGDVINWLGSYDGEPTSLEEAYEDLKGEDEGEVDWMSDDDEEQAEEDDHESDPTLTTGVHVDNLRETSASAVAGPSRLPLPTSTGPVRNSPSTSNPPTNTATGTVTAPTATSSHSSASANVVNPPSARSTPSTPTELFLLRLQTPRTPQEVLEYPETKIISGLISADDFYGDRDYYVGESLNEDGSCPICLKAP